MIGATRQQQFERISNESESFRNEVNSARDDHNMDVQVQQVGVQQMPDHAPADATAKRDVDGVVHMTINTNPRDDSNAAHELGHEKDARTNTNQFFKDALQDQKDKRGPNEKAHNDRPVEQRANKFMDQVKQEVKQFQQQQKAEQKEQKKLKKTKKAKDN